MAIAQAVTCDVCGKVKGEVNHWWLVGPTKDGASLKPWDEKLATSGYFSHLCGAECVIKAVSKWMQAKAA